MITIKIIIVVLFAVALWLAMSEINKTVFTSGLCEVKTPMMVYWLKHPLYEGQKWLMQFNKDTMCYGTTSKVTYEYYKSHTEEFEVINPEYQASWKQVKI